MDAALLIPHMAMSLGIGAYSGWFAIGGINVTGAYGKGSNDFGFL